MLDHDFIFKKVSFWEASSHGRTTEASRTWGMFTAFGPILPLHANEKKEVLVVRTSSSCIIVKCVITSFML